MKKSYLKRFINNLREDIPIQIVNLMVYLLDFFYKIPPPAKNSEKYILLVRTDLLGDFIIWLKALIYISQKYKNENYKVILLGNEIWTSLAQKTKIFDVVLPVNRKKYFKDFNYRKNILNELNKYNIEYLFQTALSRDFAVADSISRNVRAKNKIAFRRKPEAEYSIWNLLSNNWYSKLITTNSKEQFEFYRVKEFLGEISIPLEKYTTDISEYFEKKSPSKKYFVVLPGANAARRCLEPEKFANIISDIKNKTGWECYLCGSKSETKLGEEIHSHLKFKCNNLIGKTSLIELGDIFIDSELVLGNETGTLHYATALNKNAVCILGGGHFGRFMPYEKSISENSVLPTAVYKKMECFNCHWRCIYTDKKNEIVPCVSQITSDYVLKEINPLLHLLT
ncbi:MAG: glycosyltransferase family 9 protein [Bacteroidetes bacterium]|nr:glycosyltransferase family 9 protein [Bacteroidota bacterium]